MINLGTLIGSLNGADRERGDKEAGLCFSVGCRTNVFAQILNAIKLVGVMMCVWLPLMATRWSEVLEWLT